ncbi:formimidoylglutamase [Litchfieldia salsa]|uniref:Formimidoylglutamase n=1 Tax=Litchfieldia salsa TaxID=930152 RepID=A0A1H0WLA3_9BACI|nr:formimidoylglutamase [Litchfieldia salsa]SDP91341.1 formiminoglutamase [Litchfieldia salsa]
MEFKYVTKSGTAVFQDRYVTKADRITVPYNENRKHTQKIGLVGAPLSKSSISHSGAGFAPATIRKMLQSFTTYSIDHDRDLASESVVDYGDILMHPTDIVESQKRIRLALDEILHREEPSQLIILGGDHSVSYPAISSFSGSNRVGVIQFDAHHDLRNLEDGGPTNGTPFRSLIEGKCIQGENLVQIGIRDFMNSKIYTQYAQQHGVTVYTMQDVRKQSIKKIVEEAITLLKRNKVDMIYVSVDMDVLDQSFAPGCPAIGPGGMDSHTLIEAIEILGACQMVKAMDIVEIDPTVDYRDMTSKIASWLILSYLRERELMVSTVNNCENEVK